MLKSNIGSRRLSRKIPKIGIAMKRIGPLSSIFFRNRRSKSSRMKIVTEAWRENKVDKTVVLEKESEPQYAEHSYGLVTGMGITAISMTEHLNDADNEAGTFGKLLKEKPKPFETCSRNLKRKQILISDQPMKKRPKLIEIDSGKVERKQSAPIEESTPISTGKLLQPDLEGFGIEEMSLTEFLEGVSDDSDVEPGMEIKVSRKKPTPEEERASFKRWFTTDFVKGRVFTPEELDAIKKEKSWPLRVVEIGEEGDTVSLSSHNHMYSFY